LRDHRSARIRRDARDRVIKEYGADKGLVQTMARLAEHLAATN
jgi:hypothetical protein